MKARFVLRRYLEINYIEDKDYVTLKKFHDIGMVDFFYDTNMNKMKAKVSGKYKLNLSETK